MKTKKKSIKNDLLNEWLITYQSLQIYFIFIHLLIHSCIWLYISYICYKRYNFIRVKLKWVGKIGIDLHDLALAHDPETKRKIKIEEGLSLTIDAVAKVSNADKRYIDFYCELET